MVESDLQLEWLLCQHARKLQLEVQLSPSPLISLPHCVAAAKAAGIYQLQRLHRHGHHIASGPSSLDHDAFLHVAKHF